MHLENQERPENAAANQQLEDDCAGAVLPDIRLPFDGLSCYSLSPRELAEICERSRVHKHKAVIQWHVDGTASVENPPLWVRNWLKRHRGIV